MRLLLSTRKGLVVYNHSPRGWKYHQVHFLGIPVSYTYVDSRDGTW